MDDRLIRRCGLAATCLAMCVVAAMVLGGACDCRAESPIVGHEQSLLFGPSASVMTLGPQRFAEILPDPLDRNGSLMSEGGPMLVQLFDEFTFEDEADKVNVTKATLFSFVLPGAGQWYAGDKNRAGVFLAGEGVMWAAFAYFKTVQSIKERDYEAYALANAGINPDGKDDDFYRILSFYLSREEYNSAGRIIDPSRPYYPDNEYWDWRWRSELELNAYRDLRNQRAEARNRSRFALGALALNRVLSAFDAWRVAKSVNRKAKMEVTGWKIRVKGKPFGDDPSVMLTFKRDF